MPDELWGALSKRKELSARRGFPSSVLSGIHPQAKGRSPSDVTAALPEPSTFPLLLFDGMIFTAPRGPEEITEGFRRWL